jgi:hypothetical protein
MKRLIRATGVVAMLATSPVFAEDANETFIGMSAKVHQLMIDTLLVGEFCPKITVDREAVNKEALRIAGNGAPEILKAFGNTVQGQEYLRIQTEKFKGGPNDPDTARAIRAARLNVACEWAWLTWGPGGGQKPQSILMKRRP